MNILKERIKIERKIEDWQTKLYHLRIICPHTNYTGEYKGNTGNWCKHDDSYWINIKCEDCGKRWQVDSEEHKEEYRNYSRSGKIK